MARINPNEVENFAPTPSNKYFSLADDNDSARVRIMYENANEFYPYSVHKVKVGQFDKYVDCLRQRYDSPMDDCPLCMAQNKAIARYYIPLFNEEKGESCIWERGYNIKQTIEDALSECGNTPPVSCVMTVTRHGVANDWNTTYEVHADVSDGTTLQDLVEEFNVEIPDPLGTTLLSKTKEELSNFVSTGYFDNPPTNNNGFARPNRAVPNTSNTNGSQQNASTFRRRPVSSNNNIPL